VIERFSISGLPDTIDPALFPAIAEGEMKGDAGYQKWADAEEDPEVQRLLRLNGREETKHAERLRQVVEILGAG
jgi:rubrerythrin